MADGTDMAVRAIPIDVVAEYLVQQMTCAEEADARGNAAFAPIPGVRERATWLRYVHRELSLADEAGVGAVLAPAVDDALLDQLCLLGEQLYWQEQINTVPRTLTEHAVRPPFYKYGGSISADRSVWCRQQLGRRR